MAGDDHDVNVVWRTALEQPECLVSWHPQYDIGWYATVARVRKDALIVDALRDPRRLESWLGLYFRFPVVRLRYSFTLDDRHGRQRNYSWWRLRSGGRAPGHVPVRRGRSNRRKTWIHQSH